MSTSEAQRVPAIRPPVSATKPVLNAPSRGPFPLPRLAVRRTSAVLYGVSTIDNRGRLVDARLMRELAWPPGLALTVAEARGILHITPDAAGTLHITSQGHVRIPAPLRHLCALTPGERVLLAADPDQCRLTVFPPAVLDTLLANGDAP
jgi:hypothetical protein